MGYNIEISFDVLKNGGVTELLNDITSYAKECFCDYFYDDFEYDNNTMIKRNHCVVTINFSQTKLNNMVEFLINIRKKRGVYIELIYDETNNKIVYASQYFITQKMDKGLAKEFVLHKRKKNYTNDESNILYAISKKS